MNSITHKETTIEYLERITSNYKGMEKIDREEALKWLRDTLYYAATKKLPKELVSVHTLK